MTDENNKMDYDKQFQEDLDKATALSLEQQALDEYRRKKKYSYTTTTSSSSSSLLNNGSRDIRRFHSTSAIEKRDDKDKFLSLQQQQQRKSVGVNRTEINDSSKDKKKVNETIVPTDNDLISFCSSPSSSTTFDKLIEDFQNLQTSIVPKTPNAALALRQRDNDSSSLSSSSAAAAAAAASGVVSVQNQNLWQSGDIGVSGGIIPSMQQHQEQNKKKKPLTGDELDTLYGMSYVQHNAIMPQQQLQTYGHIPRLSNVPIASSINMPMSYYTAIHPHNVIYRYNQTAEPFLYSIPKQNQIINLSNFSYGDKNKNANNDFQLNLLTKNQGQINNNNNNNNNNGNSSKMGKSVADAANVVNQTKFLNQYLEQDLIYLEKDDSHRVSVLEAFDPLLNKKDDIDTLNIGSDNNNTYYSDYDDFDYWFSDAAMQQQRLDPVFEAVNKTTNASVAADDDTYNSINQKKTNMNFVENQNISKSPEDSSRSNFDKASAAAEDKQQQIYPHLYEMISDYCTIDPEILEFYFMIKDVRSRYLHNDVTTNTGHIIASEFNYHYPENTSIKIVVHPSLSILQQNQQSTRKGQQIQGYGTPVVFTCDITTTIELIINQVLCSLEGFIKGDTNDYIMKPIGLSEWILPSSKLSQLEFVHNSLKLEKDVHFGLCLKTVGNMTIVVRSQRDDANDLINLRPEDILPTESTVTGTSGGSTPIVTYDDMIVLLGTFETEIDKLEARVKDAYKHSSISCSGVIQAVKAICAFLGSLETIEIQNSIIDLVKCLTNNIEPSSSSAHIDNDNNRSTRCSYISWNILKSQCDKLRKAVLELIKLYSSITRVGFSLKMLDCHEDSIHISCVSKPLLVCINFLHRLPPYWKYDSYSLSIQINYGTRFISEIIVIKCSNDTSGGFFPCLNFSSWNCFEKNLICSLPRESRLVFVLYGTRITENDQSSSETGIEKRKITTEIGWCAIQLFDYKRDFICGPRILPVWPPTNDKFLGPAPALTSHPQADTCPILSIEIPSYGGRIQFPETEKQQLPFQKLDLSLLDINLQDELLNTAEQGYSGATDKREVFWEKRHYLHSIPHALPKILHAAHSWDYASIIDLHALLNSWSPLSPLQAFELLLPRYPDIKVREKAVEWISLLPNDHLVDFLPQLLQSLKHDTYEASMMARFLLSKSLESPRIAHHIYWLLNTALSVDDSPLPSSSSSLLLSSSLSDSRINQSRFHRRNQMMLSALLAICGEKLLTRFMRQNLMCKTLTQIAESLKDAKESLKQMSVTNGMSSMNQELVDKLTPLPLGPQFEVCGVNVRNCGYFNSNTLPLKISYIGTDSQIIPALYKVGDDLQQDMLTIQLIRMMNKFWLADGLDLKIITFNCVATGHRKGMIELVPDSETLRKIQVEYGLTGSFKDRPIAEWLAKHNPSQLEYQRAVKNFTVSCAGYSVATYILGICDRHNDNIMLKTSGHLFHIDFGKFLGDAQMFGNFKRDRVPFVLTSDMAYVINGGEKVSTDFHYFVDLCCRAFNIVRKHGDVLLHMLALMATAGIPGVTSDAVTYVRGALLPSQSNPEAAASFAKLIQHSLKSWFTQFNFFLHNLAQIRFPNGEGVEELLSFVPRKYTMQQDGRLKSVMVVRYQKHYDIEKYYTYILQVTRHSQPDSTYLFRSYKEFTEFHQKLCMHFPLAKLHSLSSGVYVGRSNIKSVAERRLPEIQLFLISLFNSADEIAHSDLVYTFFHPILRDQQEAKLEMSKVRDTKNKIVCANPFEAGQIKISFQYRRGALTVMIHHAKGLPLLQNGQEPSTYVKCYLKPDETKLTKRKTKVVRKSCVPSFMETLEYRMPLKHIQCRILHVSIWSHDALQENELLGGFLINLSKYDLNEETIDWFRLGAVSRNHEQNSIQQF